MYICFCNPTTDTHIRKAIADGADNVRALRDQLGVTQGCGKCGKCVKRLLKESMEGERNHGMCRGGCGK